jgi:hypothetical protein
LNALLSTHALAGRLPLASVHVNQNDTEGDGGIDGVVDEAIPPALDPTGRFGVPTCWQFKARPTGQIKAKVAKGKKGGQQVALREMIADDPHSRQLVEQGYGYRLCIAADMPHRKKMQWEGWLRDAAREINADAPAPMVLTASDLANWANLFKPIVSDYFRAYLGQFRSLERWRKEITSLTPEFVAITGWNAAVVAIREHASFSRSVATILTVHGEAGVGKTRCTCEALLHDSGHHAVVLYTDDEAKALEFAHVIASTNHLKAVLVADECSWRTRERLRPLVAACPDRLRVIAIDNSLQLGGGAEEVRLTHITIDEVGEILLRNFAHLPAEQIHSCARVTGGFVRLAVYLCEHDAKIPSGGQLDSFGFFRDYLHKCLRDEEDSVLLISLVSRVGFRGDLATQLERLCAHPMLELSPKDIRDTAKRLRNAPGFIAFGGRYLYVTPLLIAQVGFRRAWERWIEHDPKRFLTEFPSDLIDAFMERLQSAGTDAMKEVVSDFFLDWVKSLGPPDLGNEANISRLVQLIEVSPSSLAPLLRELTERASIEELRQVHSGYNGEKARRELVWLAEKLAYFGEYFADAEAILLRLALAETEPHLGNSASRIWGALFRIALSGTPVPFPDRIRLLEARLREADATQLTLALQALDEVLTDGPVSHLAAPPLLFGRLPPEQWRPADRNERRACRRLALAMASRLAAEGGPVAEGLRTTVIRRLSPLLLEGYIEEAQAVIGVAVLTDALLAAVVGELEKFLDVFCRDHALPGGRTQSDNASESNSLPTNQTRRRIAAADLEARVRNWYRSLVPSNLHGRLVSIVGLDPWQKQLFENDAAWQRGLRELAAELLQSPAAMSREQDWLCSREARSALYLGQALGEADREGLLLERMLSEFPIAGGTPLAQGYLDRFATNHVHLLDQANRLLDRLQAEEPKAAYELLWSAGDEVRKVPRLLQMVDSGSLTADYLLGLAHGVRDRPLTRDELFQALERLVQAAKAGKDRAPHAAVHLLFRWLHSAGQIDSTDRLRHDEGLREVLVTVLELASDAVGRGPIPWTRLVEDLAAIEPSRALELAVGALVGDDYTARHLAEDCLVRLAASHPVETMHRLGEAILRPITGWRFRVHDFPHLFGSLPVEVIESWLLEAGADGARGLARHLEPPLLNDEGRPIVPPLTAFVLNRFANDDKVFQEFIAGTQSMHTYRRDLPGDVDHETEVARHFLGHPLRRVREWARNEIEHTRKESAFWLQHEEEMVHN